MYAKSTDFQETHGGHSGWSPLAVGLKMLALAVGVVLAIPVLLVAVAILGMLAGLAL